MSTENRVTFAAGNVSGLVGAEPGSLTSTTAAGEGTVTGKYGHQVNGSQCPSQSDDQTANNDLGMTFTREPTNNTKYTVSSDARMTEKTRNRRSLDNNCVEGPPTWAPEPEVRATAPTISYPGTSNPTVGGQTSAGGTWVPAPVPHVPNNPNGTNEGATGNDTPPGTTGGAWRTPTPAGGLPNPDPGADTRSEVLQVHSTVSAKMKGTAIEIIVPFDNLSAKVIVHAKITPG
jgi:hypothetical protein